MKDCFQVSIRGILLTWLASMFVFGIMSLLAVPSLAEPSARLAYVFEARPDSEFTEQNAANLCMNSQGQRCIGLVFFEQIPEFNRILLNLDVVDVVGDNIDVEIYPLTGKPAGSLTANSIRPFIQFGENKVRVTLDRDSPASYSIDVTRVANPYGFALVPAVPSSTITPTQKFISSASLDIQEAITECERQGITRNLAYRCSPTACTSNEFEYSYSCGAFSGKSCCGERPRQRELQTQQPQAPATQEVSRPAPETEANPAQAPVPESPSTSASPVSQPQAPATPSTSPESRVQATGPSSPDRQPSGRPATRAAPSSDVRQADRERQFPGAPSHVSPAAYQLEAPEQAESECELVSARWEGAGRPGATIDVIDVFEGSAVSLVAGAENCENQEIEFHIFERGVFGWGNAPVGSAPSAIVQNGRAEAIWTAEYQEDGFLQGRPEFMFTVRQGNGGMSRDSENLIRVGHLENPLVPLQGCVPESCGLGLEATYGDDALEGVNLFLGALERAENVFSIEGITFNLSLDLFYSRKNLKLPSEMGGDWIINKPFMIENEPGQFILFLDGDHFQLIGQDGIYYMYNDPNTRIRFDGRSWSIEFTNGHRYVLAHQTTVGELRRWDISEMRFGNNAVAYEYEDKVYALENKDEQRYQAEISYLKRITDEVGRAAVFSYRTTVLRDGAGFPFSVLDAVELTDPNGAVVRRYEFQYNRMLAGVDQVSLEGDQRRTLLSFGYYGDGRLAQITNEFGGTASFFYTGDRVSGVTVFNGVHPAAYLISYSSGDLVFSTRVRERGRGSITYVFGADTERKGLLKEQIFSKEDGSELSRFSFEYDISHEGDPYYQNLVSERHQEGVLAISTEYSDFFKGKPQRILQSGFEDAADDDIIVSLEYDPGTLLIERYLEEDGGSGALLYLEEYAYTPNHLIEEIRTCADASEASDGICERWIVYGYRYDDKLREIEQRVSYEQDGAATASRSLSFVYEQAHEQEAVFPSASRYGGDLLISDTYDPLNQLLSTDYPVESSFQYDEFGFSTSVQSASSHTSYAYDFDSDPVHMRVEESINDNSERATDVYFEGTGDVLRLSVPYQPGFRLRYTYQADIGPDGLLHAASIGSSEGTRDYEPEVLYLESTAYSMEYSDDMFKDPESVGRGDSAYQMSRTLDSRTLTLPTGYTIIESLGAYGEVQRRSYGGSEEYSVAYDLDRPSHTLTVTRESIRKVLTFNLIGQVVSDKTFSNGELVSEIMLEYDLFGEVSAAEYIVDGEVRRSVQMERDDAGRLVYYDDGSDTLASRYANNQLDSVTDRGRLRDIRYDGDTVSYYDGYAVSYDGVGRIIHVVDRRGDEYALEWDSIDRPIRITKLREGVFNVEVRHTYYPWGIRQTESSDGSAVFATVDYTYDEDHTLIRIDSTDRRDGSAAVMEFSALGEITRVDDNGNEYVFSYGPPHKLRSIRYPDDSIVDQDYIDELESYATRDETGEISAIDHPDEIEALVPQRDQIAADDFLDGLLGSVGAIELKDAGSGLSGDWIGSGLAITGAAVAGSPDCLGQDPGLPVCEDHCTEYRGRFNDYDGQLRIMGLGRKFQCGELGGEMIPGWSPAQQLICCVQYVDTEFGDDSIEEFPPYEVMLEPGCRVECTDEHGKEIDYLTPFEHYNPCNKEVIGYQSWTTIQKCESWVVDIALSIAEGVVYDTGKMLPWKWDEWYRDVEDAYFKFQSDDGFWNYADYLGNLFSGPGGLVTGGAGRGVSSVSSLYKQGAKAFVRNLAERGSGAMRNFGRSFRELPGDFFNRRPAFAGCSSFLAGTEVETSEGKKAIEELRAGDIIQSYSISQEQENKNVVTEVIRGMGNSYLILQYGNQQIETTGDHLFFTGKGYTPAELLAPGDTIFVLENGSLVPTEVTDIETVNEKVRTYNLEVKGDHNYFANGALVHNIGCPTTPGPRTISQRGAEREIRANRYHLGDRPNVPASQVSSSPEPPSTTRLGLTDPNDKKKLLHLLNLLRGGG